MGFRSRARNVGLGLALLLTPLSAVMCGARSTLKYGPPKPPTPACTQDSDCPGFDNLCNPSTCQIPDGGDAVACVNLTPKDCDDGDPCTSDICDPTTALCSHPPATLDLDGDGHRAPRPGFAPGAPGSCGDDCDDTNPNAHPGGVEVCDGVDNDCNGVVDDGADFLPLGMDPVRVNGNDAPAGPRGLAWSGTSYAATYSGTTDGFSYFLSTIAPEGVVLNPPGEQAISLTNADASGGPIVWVGDRYGTTWEDRRSGDYQIYFTILDVTGAKKHADVQLTFEQGFSISPSLGWNGTEFLVVWQDDRNGLFDLFGQRVAVDGTPIGTNLQLTQNDGTLGNESPAVAVGEKSVGVAWGLGDATSHAVRFQTYSTDMAQPASQVVEVTDGTSDAVYPTVVWNHDRYVVAWFDRSANPAAIYAAAVGEDGSLLVKPHAVSSPGPFHSRYPSLRPLGDRVLLVYSDDRDQNDGYEIYSRMLTADLDPAGAEVRITNAGGDSINPFTAFGPAGNLGIFFRDDRDGGNHNVYFTRLGCVSSGP